MTEPTETRTVGNLTVKVIQDDDPCSPHEWDNLGKWMTWHRRYDLTDDSLKRLQHMDPETFAEYAAKEGWTLFPLFMLDHSGVTFSVSPFGDPWDSGQLGYVVVTPESRAAIGSAEKDDETIVRAEVKIYSQWSSGDVWGYVVETEDGDVLDSCWGFIGDPDYAMTEGVAAAEHHVAETARLTQEAETFWTTHAAL